MPIDDVINPDALLKEIVKKIKDVVKTRIYSGTINTLDLDLKIIYLFIYTLAREICETNREYIGKVSEILRKNIVKENIPNIISNIYKFIKFRPFFNINEDTFEDSIKNILDTECTHQYMIYKNGKIYIENIDKSEENKKLFAYLSNKNIINANYNSDFIGYLFNNEFLENFFKGYFKNHIIDRSLSFEDRIFGVAEYLNINTEDVDININCNSINKNINNNIKEIITSSIKKN